MEKKVKSTGSYLEIASYGIFKDKTKGKTRGRTKQNLVKLMVDSNEEDLFSGFNLDDEQVAEKVCNSGVS